MYAVGGSLYIGYDPSASLEPRMPCAASQHVSRCLRDRVEHVERLLDARIGPGDLTGDPLVVPVGAALVEHDL